MQGPSKSALNPNNATIGALFLRVVCDFSRRLESTTDGMLLQTRRRWGQRISRIIINYNALYRFNCLSNTLASDCQCSILKYRQACKKLQIMYVCCVCFLLYVFFGEDALRNRCAIFYTGTTYNDT